MQILFMKTIHTDSKKVETALMAIMTKVTMIRVFANFSHTLKNDAFSFPRLSTSSFHNLVNLFLGERMGYFKEITCYRHTKFVEI